MSTPSNHWKLGLFVTLGIGLGLVTMGTLGARSLRHETVPYTFYFDESVQGLDKGSATKFRGVTVGTVAAIDVAPDRRRVEVTSDMDVAELRRLGLAEVDGKRVRLSKPVDLRVQLASQGVTGLKYLLIDFYDPTTYPPPVLPFPPKENYVPTATSTFKQLEDSATSAIDRLPVILDALLALVTRMTAMLESMDVKGLSERSVAALTATNQLLASVKASIDGLDARGLSQRMKTTMDGLGTTLAHLDAVATRLSDDKGVLASAQRTSDALGRVARKTTGASAQLEETLRGIQRAAEAIQRVADGLEDDPDMLVKGRRTR